MMRLSHIAAPAALSVSLLLGVGGCSHERHEEVPASAMMTAEGDERLSAIAPDDGRVFVVDTNDDEIIYSGSVEKGDEISLNPEDNRLMVAGRTALEKRIDRGHRHRIFFDNEERDGTEKTVIMEETTIKRSD